MGRLKDISIRGSGGGRAAVAARRCKNCMRARVGPPRSATSFLFGDFPRPLRHRTPGPSSHSSGGRLVVLLAFLPNVPLPFALPRYRASPLALHPQFFADLAVATTGHPTVPARQDTFKLHTRSFFMKIVSFLFYSFFYVFSRIFHISRWKTIRPRKQEQLPCNAPAIVCFPHARTPSAAVIPNRAQGALSFILSDCIWRSPQSPVRACTAL
jgi:hypothetical protein